MQGITHDLVINALFSPDLASTRVEQGIPSTHHNPGETNAHEVTQDALTIHAGGLLPAPGCSASSPA